MNVIGNFSWIGKSGFQADLLNFWVVGESELDFVWYIPPSEIIANFFKFGIISLGGIYKKKSIRDPPTTLKKSHAQAF
jgi:hypothetical protein